MATLLHHIHPWMQKSITEEERIEKRVTKLVEQQLQAVHKHLDAFELRGLARPAPTADLSSIVTEMVILRPDVDAILEMRGTNPDSAPTKLA